MASLRQTWDNHLFFADSADPTIALAVQGVKAAIAELALACQPFAVRLATAATLEAAESGDLVAVIQPIHCQRTTVIEKLGNVHVFIASCLSVDAQDTAAKTWKPTLQQLWAELDQAMKPLQVFLIRANDAFIETLLAVPELAEMRFGLECDRKLKDQLLSVVEEQIIAGLGVHGLQTWGNLYTELAGILQCEVQGETMGLAKASNLLHHPDRATREAAWRGIQTAWTSRQETVATILNAINGWRLEETQQRAQHGSRETPQARRELHYLDKSCHQSRIERQTLEALMTVTYEQRSIGQRAIKVMAKALQIPQMAPWDLMAAAPSGRDSGSSQEAGETFTFDEAIALIAEAFGQLTPAMGEFVVMMAEKGWIDAAPTPYRATGAYCTQFSAPREPRIFMTFEGTMSNVTTLAHELGHAWHNWVMRDLPQLQTYYPMTLAETASVFGETLVRAALLQRAGDREQKRKILWQDLESAAAFLINIPARFEFEKRLVEARKQGFVVADQLKVMMRESWAYWYEDSLSEYDEMFWASKLHFSIAQLGFYNYPYLFGYLFSLGIYAQRDRYGADFNALYTAILRDTGVMTAETVVAQHLGQDIREPAFWEASLAIVERSVEAFEQLY